MCTHGLPVSQLEVAYSREDSFQVALLILEDGGGELLLDEGDVVQQNRVTGRHVPRLKHTNTSGWLGFGIIDIIYD